MMILNTRFATVTTLFAVSHSRTQWIDKIRTMRASNMARQGVLSKVSGELQRKIGLKVGDASCEP